MMVAAGPPFPCRGHNLPQDAKYATKANQWHKRMVSPWSILSLGLRQFPSALFTSSTHHLHQLSRGAC